MPANGLAGGLTFVMGGNMEEGGQQGFFSDRDGTSVTTTGPAEEHGRTEVTADAPPDPKEPATDFEGIAEKLLLFHETVRDPIHGDIWITLLERQLIDTDDFQRLRGIVQLGPVSCVYPGAVHTRFLHSLGTLYVAEQFVEICNRNEEIGNKGVPRSQALRIHSYAHLLVRLYALLHDVAHIPFGHTLSQEGNLMADEWTDARRAERFFGKKSKLRGALETALRKLAIDERFIQKLTSDLYTLLTHDDKCDPMELEYPYVRDLVGNTVCADLWDYLQRDMYYCGLKERSGDRFVNYIAVLPLKRVEGNHGDPENEVFEVSPGGKGRVVLLAFRYERDREDVEKLNPVQKKDVLSEAIDLLRRRYSLAEKVYFHRTKIAASSLLISAVASSKMFNDKDGDEEKEQREALYGATDPDFLKQIASDADPRCAVLAKAYRERRLFKPIYRITYHPAQEEDEQSRHLWKDIYKKFRDYKKRVGAEVSLEKEFALGAGTVSIYCPDKEMNLKEFRVLVALHPEPPVEVKPLRHILDEPRRQEMKAIRDRFHSLWTLEVFVDPTKLDPTHRQDPIVQAFSGACESPQFFGLPNDLHEDLRNKSYDRQRTCIDRAAKRWDSEHPENPVTNAVYQALVCGEHRDPEGSLQDHVYAKLSEMMQKSRKG
jgi:hypothetical protein